MPVQNITSNEIKKEKRKSWTESISDYIPFLGNKDDADNSPEIDKTERNPREIKLEKNNRFLKQKKLELEAKVTELNNNLSEVEEEREELKISLDSELSSHGKLKTKYEKLLKDKEKISGELQKLRENEEAISRELDKVISESEALADKFSDLELKVDDYKEKEKQLNDELAKEKLKNYEISLTFSHQLKKEKAELIAERDRRPNITLNDYHNLVREKNTLLQDVRDLMAENRQFQSDIDDRIAERDAETARADNLQTQLNNANQNITSLTNEKDGLVRNIVDARTILGIPLLKDLKPLPSGKTLPDLINFFNNPPSCLNPLHNDYDNLKKERDNLQTELSTTQQERDSYKLQLENAEQAKTKLAQEKEELATKNKELEVKILNQIITECKLWDTERERERERERESSLEQVITRIKELIAKTPDSAATTITDLRAQLAAKEQVIQDLQKPTAKPNAEIKQAIIEKGQELGLDTQSWTNINSYQELITQQNAAFKSKLNSEISQKESLSQDKNSAQTLNIFLGVLSLGSLLILAYLLMKDLKTKMKKIS